MKPLSVAEGIVPLGEFKAKASAYLKVLKARSSPLVITQNGRPAAVMMAPEDYDRLQERQQYLEAVAAGLSDSLAGRTIDHARVAEWLASWGTDNETRPPL
jgi:antitoxin YefM